MNEPFPTSTRLVDYYERVYRPSMVHDDRTRMDYLSQIGWFNRFYRECCCWPEETRDVTIGNLSDELIQAALDWRVENGSHLCTAKKLRRTIRAVWRFALRPRG